MSPLAWAAVAFVLGFPLLRSARRRMPRDDPQPNYALIARLEYELLGYGDPPAPEWSGEPGAIIEYTGVPPHWVSPSEIIQEVRRDHSRC